MHKHLCTSSLLHTHATDETRSNPRGLQSYLQFSPLPTSLLEYSSNCPSNYRAATTMPSYPSFPRPPVDTHRNVRPVSVLRHTILCAYIRSSSVGPFGFRFYPRIAKERGTHRSTDIGRAVMGIIAKRETHIAYRGQVENEFIVRTRVPVTAGRKKKGSGQVYPPLCRRCSPLPWRGKGASGRDSRWLKGERSEQTRR